MATQLGYVSAKSFEGFRQFEGKLNVITTHVDYTHQSIAFKASQTLTTQL